MKNKVLITILFAALTTTSKASEIAPLTKEQITNNNEQLLAKVGLYLPKYNEINIVKASTYTLSKPGIKADDNEIYMASKIKEYLAMHKEQQQKGYVNTPEPRAKELKELKHIAQYNREKHKENLSPESTHLREHLDEIKLAYTFVGVPQEEISTNLGFSPYGAYKSIKDGDEADGWDGAVQFFENNNIGACAFTEHNRKLAKSGVELIKELVSYDVQNKPTIILVKGNKKTGFIYKIKWYDNTFSRELECTNNEFSPQLRDEVIELANKIEQHQQPQGI